MKRLEAELDSEGKIRVRARRIPPSKLPRKPRYWKLDPEAPEDGTWRGRD